MSHRLTPHDGIPSEMVAGFGDGWTAKELMALDGQAPLEEVIRGAAQRVEPAPNVTIHADATAYADGDRGEASAPRHKYQYRTRRERIEAERLEQTLLEREPLFGKVVLAFAGTRMGKWWYGGEKIGGSNMNRKQFASRAVIAAAALGIVVSGPGQNAIHDAHDTMFPDSLPAFKRQLTQLPEDGQPVPPFVQTRSDKGNTHHTP